MSLTLVVGIHRVAVDHHIAENEITDIVGDVNGRCRELFVAAHLHTVDEGTETIARLSW